MGRVKKPLLLIALSFVVRVAPEASVTTPLLQSGRDIPRCMTTVSGKPYVADIDLGRGSAQVYSAKFPKEALTLLESTRHLRSAADGKTQTVQQVRIKDVSIDGFSLADVSGVDDISSNHIYYYEKESNQRTPEKELAEERPPLVLGNTAFRESKLLFDLPNHTLTLFEKNESNPEMIQQWASFPFEYVRGCMVIDCLLNGKPSRLMFDSGSNVHLLYDPQGNDDDPFTLKKAVIDSLVVAGEPVQTDGIFQINRPYVEDVAGILGLPFFENRPLFIDFPQQRIYTQTTVHYTEVDSKFGSLTRRAPEFGSGEAGAEVAQPERFGDGGGFKFRGVSTQSKTKF